MKKFYVYIHTCPNGKKYVGLTTTDPKDRWRKGEGYKSNKHFYSAIQKYKWDNIEHQVFEVDTKEEMFFLEKYFISYYQTNKNEFGYNNSIGGEKSSAGCHFRCSEDKKIKISNSLKGKHTSPDTEFKKGQKSWNKGKSMLDEQKRKISGTLKGHIVSEESRRKISESLKRRNAIKKELV